MKNHISFYLEHLNLSNVSIVRVDHEEAMDAMVYKITPQNGSPLILKISSQPTSYFREVYSLKHFSNLISVPHIIQTMPPQIGVDGAILMDCLPGELLTKEHLTEKLAHELGTILAKIHLNKISGYGDLINTFNPDPRIPFKEKFEEGLAECADHFQKTLLDKCQNYFNSHLHLLDSVDGPCIVHRDFRPGNVIVHEGKIQGIIDWASARASFAEEDFCSLEHEGWCDSYIKKYFLKGYASIRKLPDYSNIMPLLRLNKAIATIGFLVKRKTWNTTHTSLYQDNLQFLDSFL